MATRKMDKETPLPQRRLRAGALAPPAFGGSVETRPAGSDIDATIPPAAGCARRCRRGRPLARLRHCRRRVAPSFRARHSDTIRRPGAGRGPGPLILAFGPWRASAGGDWPGPRAGGRAAAVQKRLVTEIGSTDMGSSFPARLRSPLHAQGRFRHCPQGRAANRGSAAGNDSSCPGAGRGPVPLVFIVCFGGVLSAGGDWLGLALGDHLLCGDKKDG